MAYPNDEWQRKGATLSDKTARQEFRLTQDEIYDAINAGTLQYRQAYMHGNPWLRLLRREVEALARTKRGDRYVNEQQAPAELTRVNREIRRLRTELAELEERRAIRLRHGFSPEASRVRKMPRPRSLAAAALRVAGRSPSGRITMPLPSALSTSSTSLVHGTGTRWA